MNYRIVETFDSIQGEATFAGARMFFIRLAGCNVGKYEEPVDEKLKQLRVINPKHSICTSALGNSFLCDTDYHSTELKTEKELAELAKPYADIVCLTGGEPFLWDLRPLVDALQIYGKRIHIETSGTLPIQDIDVEWITCSPKKDFRAVNLGQIDEWKFVVDRSMGRPIEIAKKITDFVMYARSKKIFIQPNNGVSELDKDNIDFAIEVIKCTSMPWKLSVQLHKILKMR